MKQLKWRGRAVESLVMSIWKRTISRTTEPRIPCGPTSTAQSMLTGSTSMARSTPFGTGQLAGTVSSRF